jgi:hypothetical protein
LRFSWDLLEILNWAKPINPNNKYNDIFGIMRTHL